MANKIDRRTHREIHIDLHCKLDELVADWIGHTGKLPSKSTVLELMEWSAKQTENPTEPTQWKNS